MTALVLTVGIIAVSCAAIFIKLIGDVHPVIITVWRLLIASALVLPLGAVLLRRRLVEVMVIHSRKLIMASLFLSLHFIAWIASLFYTSVASSVVIVCTNPVWVGLFSFFLGERPGRNALIGIILTVAGGIVIGWGDFTISPRALFGDLLALLGAFMATGYLLAGRRIRSLIPVLEYIVPVYSMAAVIALLIGVILGLPLSGYSGEQYLLFAALAVVPQLIGHTAFNWALGFLSATVVAVVILGEPVGSTLLATVILGERLTVAKVVGALIIMTGITVTLRPARKVEEAGDSLSAW